MRIGIHAQASGTALSTLHARHRFTGVADDTRRVEVNVGQRGENARRKSYQRRD